MTMATIEITEVCCTRPSVRLVITMPAFVWALVRHRRERQMFARLSRLSPRLIRDTGFDPAAVHDAVAGTWDEVAPGRYRDR